jgi:hypothetical protein
MRPFQKQEQRMNVLNRRLGAGLLVVLSLAVLGAVVLRTPATVRAGVPATTAMTTPVPFTCSGITAGGGQRIAYQAVLITPPSGYVYSWVAQSGDLGNWIAICVVEYASMIVIDSMTGAEIQRDVNDPRAASVLDQIVQSVQINPNPTPTFAGRRDIQPDLTPPPTLAPPPTPDPLEVRCPSGATGGGRLFAYGGIIVEFPVGYVYSWTGQSDAVNGWTSLTVCVLEYGSAIVLDAKTGLELRRNVLDAQAAPILDQIAQDVTLNPMPTPYGPIPGGVGPPAPVVRGIPVLPPKTGEAGLLSRHAEPGQSYPARSSLSRGLQSEAENLATDFTDLPDSFFLPNQK